MAEVAKLTGLNHENHYKTVKGQTQPTGETMHKIMHTLKLNANFVYA